MFSDICPIDWFFYDTDNTCFGFLNSTIQWESARIVCKHYGGDLAAIRNTETQDFIKGKTSGISHFSFLVSHDMDNIEWTLVRAFQAYRSSSKDKQTDIVAVTRIMNALSSFVQI